MSRSNNGLSFKVSKLDLLIALMAAHLVQDAINPKYISADHPMTYALVLGGLTAVITLLSALAGIARKKSPDSGFI